MDKRTKEIIKHVGYPVYKVYVQMMNAYYLRHGMKTADKQFFKTFGRHIDWDDPKDLNEKINWLKFHEDMRMWARLADKYAVRSYVAKRGLEDILIPIYGHWTTARDVVDAWDSLPERFVLKSNNGSGHVLVVAGEKEKRAINRRDLYKQTRKWLRERDFGLADAEFQYYYIENCILAEKLLEDSTISSISKLPIDYKIYCCNGEPYICYVAYGRNPITHSRKGNLYDLEWNAHPEYMSVQENPVTLPKPKNWERMLEIARVLSAGHPQSRVDLYNIDGDIFFGEMTMTSGCGFDTEFTQNLFDAIGREIRLDLSMPTNEYKKK